MEDERRTQERVKVFLDARWDGMSGRQEARLSDLSLNGCFIETIGQVSLYEKLQFEIQMPWAQWLPLQGVVVYCVPGFGFAVALTELSEMQRRQVGAYVAYARAEAQKA